ncbi:hypothetical protein DAPPUDRAFT_346410, partial [Daphnia pulex]
MLSLKISYWSIIFLGLTLLSCGGEQTSNKQFTDYNPKKDNIINPYWAEFIEDAPTRSPDCWNKLVINKLKIKSIELYAFGGDNPEDTLEKKIFSFSNKGRVLEYEDFKFSETPAIWSRGTLRFYEDFEEMDITFSKHFGINRQISTRALKTDECTILLRKKNGNLYDTTFVYGSLQKPHLVITKIGKNVYSIDAYVKSTASTSEIKAMFAKVNRPEAELLFSERNVVFIENGKPVSSFMLNEELF